jgi:hypothetical protein
MSPPSSGLKSKPNKKPTETSSKLLLVFFLANSSALKMEALCL